ncbi:unnamed protein product, partial [Porites evermanni]
MTAMTIPTTSRTAKTMPRYAPHGHLSCFDVFAAISGLLAALVEVSVGRIFSIDSRRTLVRGCYD